MTTDPMKINVRRILAGVAALTLILCSSPLHSSPARAAVAVGRKGVPVEA